MAWKFPLCINTLRSSRCQARALFLLLPSSIKILRELLVHKLPLKLEKLTKNCPENRGKNAGKTATKVIRILVGVKAEKMESTTPQLDLHQVFQMCHPNQEGLISLKKLQELFQQHASENAVGLLFLVRAWKTKEINHGNQGNFNLRLFCHLTNVFPDDQIWKKKPK